MPQGNERRLQLDIEAPIGAGIQSFKVHAFELAYHTLSPSLTAPPLPSPPVPPALDLRPVWHYHLTQVTPSRIAVRLSFGTVRQREGEVFVLPEHGGSVREVKAHDNRKGRSTGRSLCPHRPRQPWRRCAGGTSVFVFDFP
jgi:hypothetical protein